MITCPPLTTELYEGTVGVDDPRHQGVREVPVSVERSDYDHDDREHNRPEYEGYDEPGGLAAVVDVSGLCNWKLKITNN